jgi:ATP-binding cassette subfamily B protein
LLVLYQAAQYWFDTRLMRAIDAARARDWEHARFLALTLVALAVLAFGVRVWSRFLMFFAGRDAEYSLRKALLSHLHRMGPEFYSRLSSGDLMSRATNDLTQVRLLLGFGVLNLVNTVLALASALTVMVSISVPLTLASMVTLPLLVVMTRAFAKRIFSRTKENQQALGDLSDVVQGSLSAMRVVRAFGLEEQEYVRFARSNDQVLDRSLALSKLRGLLGPMMQGVSAVGLVVVFWYGGHLLLTHQISEGGLLAFFRATARLTWPLVAFGYIVAIVQRGRAAYLRLGEVFATPPEIGPGVESTDAVEARCIELEHVTHEYAGRQVLSDVSLRLSQGERLAIVGPTGAGKSTLARILARVTVPTEGTILVDGVPIEQLPLSALRRSIRHSQQTPFLFSSTILQNLAFGLDSPDSDAARARAMQMGRAVRLDDEVRRLEHGYDTVVGERGIQLSGGQRQRVALGRALLASSRVLVLDDPTSAVDVETERALVSLLTEQSRERTLVVVTHRISVASICDRVVVLSDGKIVENGTPRELAAGGGLYARFCEEQRLLSEVEELSVEEPSRHLQELNRADFESAPDRRERALKAFHEESALGRAFDGHLLRRLFGYLARERLWLWVALAAVIATAVLALVRPLIIKNALDGAVGTRELEVLVRAGIAISVLMVLEQSLNFAQSYLTQLAGTRAMAALRAKLFRFLHQLPIAFFDHQPIGRLTTRVTNDIDAISELFASGALASIADLLRLVGIIAIMLWVDAQLSLAAFAALPIVVALVLVLRRPMREAFRDIRTRTARMNSALNEQINGMSVVQAFDRMDRSEREFDDINLAYRDVHLRSIRYEAMQDAALETIASIALAMMVLVYGSSVSSFGTLLAFQLYLAQFFEPLSQLAQRYTLLQSAMAGAERVFGLLDEKGRDAPVVVSAPVISAPVISAPVVSAPVGQSTSPAVIEFSNVDFSYHPGQPVLKSLDFQVRSGEHVALVGPTGSGKSTVLSLLLRLYEFQGGEIFLDRTPIRALPPDVVRSRFAYVPQDPVLFPGTILSNIAGEDVPNVEGPNHESVNFERARDVLAQIGALDHFERRLGGLRREILGSGQALSTGERQLVVFARALYRNVTILLLDEATASIDSETERRLQKALEASLVKRTAIVIAHRLGTIKTADRVLLLQRGRLVEEGTHQQLLARDGLYRRLVRLSSMREETLAS